MSKRGTGLVLIAIAAVFYVARFFIAIQFVDTWNSAYFHLILQQSGSELLEIAKLALVIGTIYFIWDDLPQIKQLLKKIYNWEEDK